RARHCGRPPAFRCDRRRHRAPLPAYYVDRGGSRAGTDSTTAFELLRADGNRADGRHYERYRVDAVLSARALRAVVPGAARRTRSAAGRRRTYGELIMSVLRTMHKYRVSAT